MKLAPHERVISKRIIDRIVDMPVVKHRQALPIQTVQKTLEVPQIQRRCSSRRRRQSSCRSRSLSTRLLTFALCAETSPTVQVRRAAAEVSQFQFSDKVIPVVQQRTDATSAVPERDAEANPSPESSEEGRDSTGSVPDKMVDVTVVPVHRSTSWK